ncbi:MAG: tetratricopeptide repeat protein, partial [Rhodothermales bacterium]|nr:tetratricopeptide repeat protein [Rhodothermales bacterium]
MRRLLFLLLALGVAAAPALAQTAEDLLEQGRQAFREERFEDAARAFERAAERAPENAEAHYLIARVYFETPLRDDRKARRALERATDLEPDNVRYLVARLQQLRTEAWNFFAERIREARRLELARKILTLDPENAYAHEELGTAYIRDFWRYRNAIMLPTLRYGNMGYQRDASSTRTLPVQDTDEGFGGDVDPGTGFLSPEGLDDFNEFAAAPDPDQVFLADQFDVEALREQGVPVVSYAGRAQHAYDKAVEHLQKSIEVDPRRRSVYDELMQIYALKGEYADALAMLDEMYKFFPEDDAFWRYLGLAHYRSGNMEAADRSFETALRFMTPEARQAYEDLSFLLPREDRDLYERDPVAFAAQYWTSKDPRYLTTYNERKLEHYFRLTYADLLYGAPDVDLRGWETERGQILVRYGPPRSDVVLVPRTDGLFEARNALAGAVVSTAYNTDASTGDPEAEIRIQNTQSFDAVFSTAAQAFEELNAYNIWEYGPFRFVFEDPFRNGEYRLYSPSAADAATSLLTWQNDYVIKTKETLNRYPERYEYEAPGRRIELPYLVSTFKGEDGQTDLYVHYGVPVADVPEDQDMIEVTARVGTFLVGENRDLLVERRRTIYGLPTAQILSFEQQHLWVDTQAMTAPPGTHDLSVEFETASGQTVAVQRRAVDVPAYDRDALAVSDLLLAYAVEDAPDGQPLGANEIVRDGLSILPAPWSVFNRNQPLYIYFETYNLERGPDGQTDYEVEISLVPKEQAKGVRKLVK